MGSTPSIRELPGVEVKEVYSNLNDRAPAFFVLTEGMVCGFLYVTDTVSKLQLILFSTRMITN